MHIFPLSLHKLFWLLPESIYCQAALPDFLMPRLYKICHHGPEHLLRATSLFSLVPIPV